MSYFHEPDEQERKLFVGGFNKATTDEDNLKTYFEHYGGIVDCTILRDAEKRSRGFGFILFDEGETVDKIMRAKKNGSRFTLDDGDTHMEVKRALPRGSRDAPTRDRNTTSSARNNSLYNKVFVGGLPSSITEDELRHYFEAYGRVNQIELLRDRETNRLRGFAFVSFEDEDSADKCIQRRSHEICRKMCEVKRAHHKAKDPNDAGIGRRPDGGYDHQNNGNRGGDRDNRDHHQHVPQVHVQPQATNLGSDVNALVQQAYLMGQQSVYQQLGLQAPAPTQLNLGLAAGTVGATNLAQPNNLLLQALATQQVAPGVNPVVPVVQPAAPAAAVPAQAMSVNTAANTSTDTLSQLAQLLQGGAVDPNTLGALLKTDPGAAQRAQSAAVGVSSNGYSTSYPGVYSQSSSNYAPAKYEEPKRGYRPY